VNESSNEETHEKPELSEGKRMNDVRSDDDGKGGSQRMKCSVHR